MSENYNITGTCTFVSAMPFVISAVMKMIMPTKTMTVIQVKNVNILCSCQ